MSALVLTAGAGLVAAGTGVAGVAGLAGLVAWVWPDMVRDGCVDEFSKADRMLRATRSGRPSDQVLSHLHTYTISDCRAGTIGLWEQVSFGERVQKYSEDRVITEFEASDLITLYQQIRRP